MGLALGIALVRVSTQAIRAALANAEGECRSAHNALIQLVGFRNLDRMLFSKLLQFLIKS